MTMMTMVLLFVRALANEADDDDATFAAVQQLLQQLWAVQTDSFNVTQYSEVH